MKKFIKTIVLLMMTFATVIGCQKDEVDTEDVPSQKIIITSAQNDNNQIRVGASITFSDNSTGVVQRLWSFPENAANLRESGEDLITATFPRVGEYDVVLNQVFRENAFENGVLSGNELETVLTVRVLDSIKTRVRANYINPEDGSLGAALNISDDAENVIEAGRSIRYFLEATGSPQQIAWTAEGGSPDVNNDNVLEFDVAYRLLGSYGINVSASSQRPRDQDIMTFMNLVTVIPSSDPVTLDEVEIRLDGTVALEYSRAINPASIIPSEFSMTLSNDGVAIPVSIADITIDPLQANVMIVSLENDAVYFDDVASISYTAGSLATTDEVSADSFTDIPASSFEGGNLFEEVGLDVGFETSATIWENQPWGSPWEDYTLSVSSAQAHSGNQSVLIEYMASGGMIIANRQSKFNVESGKTYEIGVWVYVEDLGNASGSGIPEVRFYCEQPFTDLGINPAFDAGFPTGEWIFNTVTFTSNVTGEKELLIRGDNQSNAEPLRFFMDDLSLREVTRRP
ncbi:hypothetical protein [Aquimarina sp. RZ0]|uniref:hypothetical protein n=1 Tax=Aquimarina sp. RZ0 TaxID=2607730 RepID=UPI0011F0CFC7|nr:hypothetical protein [Aquimarina sp. RZ0]KAA1243301.1 hypothetical protein F0000_21625 [Aquimarina sp. RZ0]